MSGTMSTPLVDFYSVFPGWVLSHGAWDTFLTPAKRRLKTYFPTFKDTLTIKRETHAERLAYLTLIYVLPSKFFPLFLKLTRSRYDLRNTISVRSLIFFNIFFFSPATLRMSAPSLVASRLFIYVSNSEEFRSTLTVRRIFQSFSFQRTKELKSISMNWKKSNRDSFRFEIDSSSLQSVKDKMRYLCATRREDNPKDWGVEEGKRISKLLERTFSDACALSPLSHYLKLQSIDRRRDGAETCLCPTWSQYK